MAVRKLLRPFEFRRYVTATAGDEIRELVGLFFGLYGELWYSVTYLRIISKIIMRIPIKQQVFHGKQEVVFFFFVPQMCSSFSGGASQVNLLVFYESVHVGSTIHTGKSIVPNEGLLESRKNEKISCHPKISREKPIVFQVFFSSPTQLW